MQGAHRAILRRPSSRCGVGTPARGSRRSTVRACLRARADPCRPGSTGVAGWRCSASRWWSSSASARCSATAATAPPTTRRRRPVPATSTSPTATVPASDPTKSGKGGKGKGRAARAGRAPRPRPRHPRRRRPRRRCCPTRAARAPTATSTSPRPSPPRSAAATSRSMLNLQTRASEACTWQVSPDTVVMKIISGHDHIWSSKDCSAAIPVQDVVVRRASVIQVPVVWNSRRSDDECSDRTAWALPGFYHVKTGRVGRRGDRRPVRAAGSGTADRDPDRDARVTCRQRQRQRQRQGTATATAGTDRHRVSLEAWRSYLRATRASSWTDPPRGSDRTLITIAPLCRGVYWSRTT